MKSYIINIIKLPNLYFFLQKSLKHQREIIRKTIAVDIEKIKINKDDSLSDKDFKKINDYYGYAVPAILGEGFCALRGKKMTDKERLALTYLGALTGLFDDFFDEKNTTEEHIEELIYNPNENITQNSHELLFIRFYNKALANSHDTNLLKEKFEEVFKAQVLSKKQNLPKITKKEIDFITLKKGGVSLLFYRSVLIGDITKDEENMIYKLGSLMQLENDIFDIYKDYQNNIKTLPTTETEIKNLIKKYNKAIQNTLLNIKKTGFPTKNKQFFIRFISMILYRGSVCLDCLEKNEKLTSNQFSINEYSRKQLICDMEKTKNILRLINYYAKTNIKIGNK